MINATPTTTPFPATSSPAPNGKPSPAPADGEHHAFGRELQRAADATAHDRARDAAAQTRKTAERGRLERQAAHGADQRGPDDHPVADDATAPAGAAEAEASDAAATADGAAAEAAADMPGTALPAGLAEFVHRLTTGRDPATAPGGPADGANRAEPGSGLPRADDATATHTASPVATAVHAAAADRASPGRHGTGLPFGQAIAAAAQEAAAAAAAAKDERTAAIELKAVEAPPTPTLPAQAADPAFATLAGRSPAAGPGETPAAGAAAEGAGHTLAPALESPEFAPALGARIAVFARDGIEQAQLNIHPADMGPIGVKLVLDGTQVRVDLTAEVGATRQWLEQALPALAGALQEAGFTLSGGGVFQQSRDGAGAQDTRSEAGRRAGSADGRADPAPVAIPAPRVLQRDGLVDLYA